MIKQKATVEQTVNLAKWFFSAKGIHSADVVDWFKARPNKYTIKGVEFNAVSVAFCVRGMEEIAIPKPKVGRPKKSS